MSPGTCPFVEGAACGLNSKGTKGKTEAVYFGGVGLKPKGKPKPFIWGGGGGWITTKTILVPQKKTHPLRGARSSLLPET